MIYKQAPPLVFEHSAYRDGSQTLIQVTRHDMQDQAGRGISLNHILGAAMSVLHLSEEFAALNAMPAAEFAVEVEITSTTGAPYLYTTVGQTPAWVLDRQQLVLPRYAHVAESGAVDVLNACEGDLFNSAGEVHNDIIQSVTSAR